MRILLEMGFKDKASPDFGGIERSNFDELTLLDKDVAKLNSTLTLSACKELLEKPQSFNIPSGCLAIVTDQRAVWRYHAASDWWYELIAGDPDGYRVFFYDGTQLKDRQTVAEGGTAVYGGMAPTKAADDRYTYSFAGWNADPSGATADSNALTNVKENRIVYAVFTRTEKTFTVTFKNGAETVYTASSVAYNGTAVYSGTAPTKESTEQYSYTFIGWNTDAEAEEADENALKNVRADRTVYAIFEASPATTAADDDQEG